MNYKVLIIKPYTISIIFPYGTKCVCINLVWFSKHPKSSIPNYSLKSGPERFTITLTPDSSVNRVIRFFWSWY